MSIETPIGLKLLNPVPIEEKMKVSQLSELANNPTLYVGFSGIWDNQTKALYYVSGGSTGAWIFTPQATSANQNDKGYFADETALLLAYPIGQDGWFSTNGDTDTIWVWDGGSTAWVDTSSPSTSTAAEIHSAVTKTTFLDADELGLVDSAAGWILKKFTWASLKTSLQNFFDLRYVQDISGLAEKTNVLELDNTTAFTPTADYQPATKKYSDDNSGITEVVEDLTPQLGGDMDANGKRILQEQGDDIASTSNLTLDSTINGNVYGITGTITINLIEVLDWQDGAEIVLHFTDILTITHGSVFSGNFAPIYLAKGSDYTSTPGDTISFRLINGEWFEVTNTKESGASDVLNKYDAIIAPTVNNDNTEGYSIGSSWVDTVADKAYKCLDITTGAAVWTETTQSGGGSGGHIYKENGAAINPREGRNVQTNEFGGLNWFADDPTNDESDESPQLFLLNDVDPTGKAAGYIPQVDSANTGIEFANTAPFTAYVPNLPEVVSGLVNVTQTLLSFTQEQGTKLVGYINNDSAVAITGLKITDGTSDLTASLDFTASQRGVEFTIDNFDPDNDTDLYYYVTTGNAANITIYFTKSEL